MDKTNIRAHASLIEKLGSELITDEITAFSELIKNAYDADSSFVEFKIDTEYTGKITYRPDENSKEKIVNVQGLISIEDEGHGMTLDDIKSGWLVLSNSKKRKQKSAGYVTPQFKRIPLGEKGLGRLSVQRLSRYTQLITTCYGSDIAYKVMIPWIVYQGDVVLEDIDIFIESIPEEQGISYTKLFMYDLRDLDSWNNPKYVSKVKNNILQISSPFSQVGNFSIYGKINDETFSSNKFNENLLVKAKATYNIFINCNSNEIKIDTELSESYFYKKDANFDKTKVSDYLSSVHWPKDTEYNQIKGKISISENIQNLESIDGIYELESYNPGDFTFTLYDFSLSRGFFEEFILDDKLDALSNVTKYKEIIKNYHGVYVTRDDFTVFPYGVNHEDWLGINKSSGTTGSYYHLKNETLIGIIKLTSKNNSLLREKTDREGFINDAFYLNFDRLLKHAINRINVKRNAIQRGFNGYVSETENERSNIHNVNQASEAFKSSFKALEKKKGPVQATLGIEGLGIKDDTKETFSRLNDSVKFMEKTLEFQKEKIESLTSVAANGLMTETIFHEFNRSIREMSKSLKHYKEGKNKDVESFVMDVEKFLRIMSGHMKHVQPYTKNLKSDIHSININSFIENFSSYYIGDKERNISIENQTNASYTVQINRGKLTQILDNLYDNSKYWLLHALKKQMISHGVFTIETPTVGKVLIYDNGLGVTEGIASQIFNPFVSDKEDGHGLGLYIVKELLISQGYDIRLLEDRNSHGNRFKFLIDLGE